MKTAYYWKELTPEGLLKEPVHKGETLNYDEGFKDREIAHINMAYWEGKGEYVLLEICKR